MSANVVALDLQSLPRTRTHVGQKDVALGGQPIDEIAALGLFQIDGHRLLAAIRVLEARIYAVVALVQAEVTSPRYGSPVTGCSILTTSAPHSVSTPPAIGTNTCEGNLQYAYPR